MFGVASGQQGLDPRLDREKFLQAVKPAARQLADHDEQVDVRVMPWRPAAHRAEDGARDKAGAVRHLELRHQSFEDLFVSNQAVALYTQAIDQVVPVSGTRVAEAAKILENVYRAVNIALVNELRITFDRMGIDVWEVIEAAKTKPFAARPSIRAPASAVTASRSTRSTSPRGVYAWTWSGRLRRGRALMALPAFCSARRSS